MTTKQWPPLIQGGMGVAVSGYPLARAVSLAGQIGTVSLVALPHVVARRLQLGDSNMLRALVAFPVMTVAEKIREKYWCRNGPIPMFTHHPSRELAWLTLFGGFAEVWLAKEGHQGIVAGNLLEKVQMPSLYTMLGAMWAGIDIFIIGAGLPLQIPGILDALCAWQVTTYRLSMSDGSSVETTLDMEWLLAKEPPAIQAVVRNIAIKRPAFFPIVSLDVTANILWKKMKGRCEGFVVEDPVVAGGHNPSPRGWKGVVNDAGEPIYGERDVVNFEKMLDFEVPFWLAGGYASPAGLERARTLKAAGIQCGGIFALGDESGIAPAHKAELRRQAYLGILRVYSDPRASPTGFPFQVVQMPGTVSDVSVYEERERNCRLGYLRELYMENGVVGYRCSAEPVEDYIRKGGKIEETVGRKCLCSNLLATVGLGMEYRGVPEPVIITLGKDTSFIRHLMDGPDGAYSARDAIRYLLGEQ